MQTTLPRWLGTAVLACMSVTAFAQHKDFPARPVRIVVPVPPGGSVDTVVRLISQRMTELMGQPGLAQDQQPFAVKIEVDNA